MQISGVIRRGLTLHISSSFFTHSREFLYRTAINPNYTFSMLTWQALESLVLGLEKGRFGNMLSKEGEREKLKEKCFFLHCADCTSWSWYLLPVPHVPFTSVSQTFLLRICVKIEEMCTDSHVCAADGLWTICFCSPQTWPWLDQVYTAFAVKRFRSFLVSGLCTGAYSAVYHLPCSKDVSRCLIQASWRAQQAVADIGK